MDDGLINSIGSILIALMLGGAGWVIHNWKLTADRQRLLAEGVHLAYGVVNELARNTENKIDDKAAEALKKLAEYLQANGQEVPTSNEEKLARMKFQAMHDKETTALELAASPPTPVRA